MVTIGKVMHITRKGWKLVISDKHEVAIENGNHTGCHIEAHSEK